MEIVNRGASRPFVTKDGAVIRSILDRTSSAATHQSLAEATVAPGRETAEHYHRQTEEIYYVLRGQGIISLGGEARAVGGDSHEDTVLVGKEEEWDRRLGPGDGPGPGQAGGDRG